MKTLRLTAFLLALPMASGAQEIDSDVDFTTLRKSAFVKEMRNLAEASWPPMMQLYTRLDPSLGELTPDFEWSDEFSDAYGCVYDTLSANDGLQDVNITRDALVVFMDRVQADESVTFLTFVEDEELSDLLMPSDKFANAGSDCGVNNLNIKLVSESGLMDAMQKIMMESQ